MNQPKIIKQPLFCIIAIGVSFVLFYYWIKNRFQEVNQLKPPTIPNEKKKIHFNLEASDCFDTLNETSQGDLLKNLKQLFKSETLLPTLSFNPNWEIQLIPNPIPNSIEFKVWNETHIAPVKVSLESTEEAKNWKVSAEGLKQIHIPLNDKDQLRAVIASYLQQISTIKTIEHEDSDLPSND